MFEDNNYNFQTQNLNEYNKIKLLKCISKLLKFLINNNINSELGDYVYKKINIENKFKILQHVFVQKIENNILKFDNQMFCMNHQFCNKLICHQNLISQLDKKCYEISNQIYIFLLILSKLRNEQVQWEQYITNLQIKQKMKEYFQRRIRCVEIIKDDQIYSVYFNYPQSNLDDIQELQSKLYSYKYINDDEDRLNYFINNYEIFKMKVKQSLFLKQYKLAYFFIYQWKLLKDIQLILILTINLYLMHMDHHQYSSQNNTDQTLNILFIVQLILCTFIVIFSTIERLPNYCRIEKQFGIDKEKKKLQSVLPSRQITILQSLYNSIRKIINYFYNQTQSLVFIKVFLDIDFFYNLMIMIISYIANKYKILFVILSFDVVKRSDYLTMLVQSMVSNFYIIFKIICVALIIMYMLILEFITNNKNIKFAPIKMQQVFNNLDNNQTNFTLYQSLGFFIAQIFQRNNNQNFLKENSDSNQITDLIYNLSNILWLVFRFFLVFQILGIIFDSMFIYRKNKNQKQQNEGQLCYICGQNQKIFGQIQEGWVKHMSQEHNIQDYMNFLVFIESESNEGIMKYVQRLVQNNQIDFFPIKRSLSIERLRLNQK